MKTVAFFLLCVSSLAGDLPDSRLTPGQVNPLATADSLCTKTFTTRDERHVTEKQKREVFVAYGIVNPAKGEYEIDHLISLELGGSNDNSNLWPQSYISLPWNAHKKDVLENLLHRLVCNHTITLATAQHEISTDWIAAYKKYVK